MVDGSVRLGVSNLLELMTGFYSPCCQFLVTLPDEMATLSVVISLGNLLSLQRLLITTAGNIFQLNMYVS